MPAVYDLKIQPLARRPVRGAAPVANSVIVLVASDIDELVEDVYCGQEISYRRNSLAADPSINCASRDLQAGRQRFLANQLGSPTYGPCVNVPSDHANTLLLICAAEMLRLEFSDFNRWGDRRKERSD
jgi:hypothetical protein